MNLQVVEYESETHKLTNYLKNSEIIFRQYFNISDSKKVTLDQVYEQLTQIVTAVSCVLVCYLSEYV